jgi:hypothetical protein
VDVAHVHIHNRAGVILIQQRRSRKEEVIPAGRPT